MAFRGLLIGEFRRVDVPLTVGVKSGNCLSVSIGSVVMVMSLYTCSMRAEIFLDLFSKPKRRSRILLLMCHIR